MTVRRLMSCPGENTLLDFLGGGIADEARRSLELHLDACATCRSLLEEARGPLSTESERSPFDPDKTRREPGRARTPSSPSLGGDSLVGARIGDYQVVERIGSGGMGVVYRGHQPLIGKLVAIKVLRDSSDENENRMQRMLLEARAVNAIGHRGIVDIFGFGQLPDGRHYVVMEHLQGEPLDVWIRGRPPLPLDTLLDLLDEILVPLGAAHRAGVVHRDLKPSNLFMVMPADGTRFLKLLDFGLAKRPSEAKGLTRTGYLLGTPAYMAPEQVRGESVDARTDLYSFAVVAYRLATGERPFAATEPMDQMEAHLRESPRPLRQLRPDMPAALEALLLSLLEKDPARRPSSTQEVRDALQRIRTPGVAVDRRATEPSFATPVHRRRGRLLLLATMVGVAAVGMILAVARERGAKAPPTEQPTASAPPMEERAEKAARELDDEHAPLVLPAEPPKLRAPSLTEERQRVLARIRAVRQRVESRRKPGNEPDSLSVMFLDKAEADTKQARTRAQLRQALRTVQGVEEKLLASDG